MSTPIKETPILRGKDARRFTEKITRNEQEPAPREEYDKLMANYRKVKTDKPLAAFAEGREKTFGAGEALTHEEDVWS
ncbi:MAG TPA: hypothetical protein PKN85_06475 [Syntrophorhabdaceae bacterium]|jgi:hypothetical protein|nr:MAG: hypothetical protein A4E60_03081 [Syntrophorhabdus sp. PtaB.Bin047]HNT44088.1 hypothetical protein [Syntrophorhabdaceae bacterium]HOD72454.1 hypothetical protein [Deltaproteobacteria bacterium]